MDIYYERRAFAVHNLTAEAERNIDAETLEKIKVILNEEPTIEKLASHYVNCDRSDINRFARYQIVEVTGELPFNGHLDVGDWFALSKTLECTTMASYQWFPTIWSSTRIEKDGDIYTIEWENGCVVTLQRH